MFLGEQDFYPGAVALLLTVHASRVARSEQLLQVGKQPVRDRTVGSIQRQQAGGVPLLDGMLGYEFLGEWIVEMGRPHGGIY